MGTLERRETVTASPVGSKPAGQEGAALIMVMGVIAVCMVLIAHMLLVSEVIARETLVVVLKSNQRYEAESAADSSYWMLLTDRRLFPNRRLGQTADDELRLSADYEPWMLDRRPHYFADGRIVVHLTAGDIGFRVQEPETLSQHVPLDDTERRERITVFSDVLGDYSDADDLRKLYGKENPEYVADGFPTLPRNGPPEFRAEVYWLPDWSYVIQGEVAVIPPSGLVLPGNSSRPSFYSASDDLIQQTLDLEESELEEIREARRRWEEEGELVADTLSAELLSQVSNAFDFSEAAVGQITAVAYDQGRELRSVYRIIREVNMSQSTLFSDSDRQTLAVWERMLE